MRKITLFLLLLSFLLSLAACAKEPVEVPAYDEALFTTVLRPRKRWNARKRAIPW